MSTNRGPGQAWWEMHVNAIVSEGMGIKAYAQREGLPASSLYYWRRRFKALNQQTQPPVKPAATASQRRFVPVSVGATAAADHAGPTDRYVLALGDGLRLELPGLPSPQWLAQVCQALAGQVR